jgi:hypothetical protein
MSRYLARKLSIQNPIDIRVRIKQFCITVLSFAATETPVQQLESGLEDIFQTASSLFQTFQTQDAAFFFSFPRLAPGETIMKFNAVLMNDSGYDGEGERQVGLLIYPGLFKVADGFRTCLVKCKVDCIDEIERHLVGTT